MSAAPLFSICIPAYNRARHLRGLLDSILTQDFTEFEIVICEDHSPEREVIRSIVSEYADLFPDVIRYHENPTNLGFDGNLRELVAKSSGKFCFFMGNDDIMCPHALKETAGIVSRYENVGLVLKSYAWFEGAPDNIIQTVHYFPEERFFKPGPEAISVCFRRSGVISGYVIERQEALRAATDKFDGTLYYQMHLTASVLCKKAAVATPFVLVHCRDGEAPDFGNSQSEKARYTPGRYTPEARIGMLSGALSIIEDLRARTGIDLVAEVKRDYANYFYLCIRDQLSLPITRYFRMYRAFGRMGFDRYPSFHMYCIAGYVLGQKRCDSLIRFIRLQLGHSPKWGTAR